MLPKPNTKIVFTCPNSFPVWFRSPFACMHFAIPVGFLSLPTPPACSLHLRNVASTWHHKSSTYSSANKRGFRVGKGNIAQTLFANRLPIANFTGGPLSDLSIEREGRGLMITLQTGRLSLGKLSMELKASTGLL